MSTPSSALPLPLPLPSSGSEEYSDESAMVNPPTVSCEDDIPPLEPVAPSTPALPLLNQSPHSVQSSMTHAPAASSASASTSTSTSTNVGVSIPQPAAASPPLITKFTAHHPIGKSLSIYAKPPINSLFNASNTPAGTASIAQLTRTNSNPNQSHQAHRAPSNPTSYQTASTGANLATPPLAATPAPATTSPPSYFDEFDEIDAEDLYQAEQLVQQHALRSQQPAVPTPSSSVMTSSASSNYSSISSPLYSRALSLLRKYWGHSSFRPGQFELLNAVASDRRDTFVLMSTGAGKSVCFQLLPLLTDKPVIVISPLISLMEDQVLGLTSRGIKACALNSANPSPQMTRDAMEGKYSLIYISPERLAISHANLQELEHKVGITAFAIDESEMQRDTHEQLGDVCLSILSLILFFLLLSSSLKISLHQRMGLRFSSRLSQSRFNSPFIPARSNHGTHSDSDG